MESKLETITLGGGCFWCVEAVFQEVKGVVNVESGYCNGNRSHRPTYKEVCTGTSGFAEVLKINFDSTEISLEQILDVFWTTHDPTTLNRQGNDRGTQYRSGIYYTNERQREVAFKSKLKIENAGIYTDPIVTEIEELRDYYKAESYHQEYYNQNKNTNPYCSYIITPKVAKFRSQHKALLKKESMGQ